VRSTRKILLKVKQHGCPRGEALPLLVCEKEISPGYRASTVTSVVTEFAIKHSAWARSWSAVISSWVGEAVPPNVIFGRKMTRVIASLPFAFFSRNLHPGSNRQQTVSCRQSPGRSACDNWRGPRRGPIQGPCDQDSRDRPAQRMQALEHRRQTPRCDRDHMIRTRSSRSPSSSLSWPCVQTSAISFR
jgi:hypothetical protein